MLLCNNVTSLADWLAVNLMGDDDAYPNLSRFSFHEFVESKCHWSKYVPGENEAHEVSLIFCIKWFGQFWHSDVPGKCTLLWVHVCWCKGRRHPKLPGDFLVFMLASPPALMTLWVYRRWNKALLGFKRPLYMCRLVSSCTHHYGMYTCNFW